MVHVLTGCVMCTLHSVPLFISYVSCGATLLFHFSAGCSHVLLQFRAVVTYAPREVSNPEIFFSIGTSGELWMSELRKQTLSGFFTILHHNVTGVVSGHGISLPDDFVALDQACRFWGRLKYLKVVI